MKRIELPKIPKGAKRTLASAGVLVVLIIIAGLIYIYFDGSSNIKSNNSSLTGSEVPQPIVPQKPSPNALEGAAVTVLDSPVKPGEETSISVQTLPGSECTIGVAYNHVPAQASGLGTKTADDFGNVSWDWQVASSAPAGTWPVTVTCSLNKKSAVVVGNLEVD